MAKDILHQNKCNLLRELYPLREDRVGFFEDLAAWCIEQVKVSHDLWKCIPSMDLFTIEETVYNYRRLLGQAADVAHYMALTSGTEVPKAVVTVRKLTSLNNTRTIH